jgi:hypothetical protein
MRLAKEAPEELLHFLIEAIARRTCASTDTLDRPDVHDRRSDLLDQFGEVGQATNHG